VRAIADPAGHAKGHPDALVLDGPLTMGRAFYSRPDPRKATPSNPTGSPLVGNEAEVVGLFEKLLKPGKTVVQAAKNLIEQSRPVWLGAFTLDQLVELAGKRLPQIKHYADILQDLDTNEVRPDLRLSTHVLLHARPCRMPRLDQHRAASYQLTLQQWPDMRPDLPKVSLQLDSHRALRPRR